MNEGIQSAVDGFLAHKRALGRKYDSEENELRLLVRFAGEHQAGCLAELTPALLEEFLASRPRSGPRSFNHLLGVVRCLLEWAVTRELFEFKGGTGTSSRIIDIDGQPATVGVLVNTNYGHRHQLRIHDAPVGEHLRDTLRPGSQKEGSCIVVIATDVPLHPGQLRRLARRVDAGLARTGSSANDGSGEIALAFSTANHIPREGESAIDHVLLLRGGQFWTAGAPLDLLFEAAADATEEASLNALFSAETMHGRDGHVLHAIPLEWTLEFLERWHVPVRQ